MAAGGAVFLDEIVELPARSQAKLLKFLDTLRFRRLGGQREIAMELRVIAATNQDVEALVKAGRFPGGSLPPVGGLRGDDTGARWAAR